MNYPDNAELKQIEFIARDIPNAISLTISKIKQLNPEPELVWPKGADYVVLDNAGLWWYANKPYYEGMWDVTSGDEDHLSFVLYPALCEYAMKQFMNKPASECLIERVR